MKTNILLMMLCLSCGMYNGALATRVFRMTVPITNTSQYPITVTNQAGEKKVTIDPDQTAQYAIAARETVRITVSTETQDISKDVTRGPLDISWNVELNADNTDLLITKTQQKAGRYDPAPRLRL